MNMDMLPAVNFKLLCDIEDCVFPQACEFDEYPTLSQEIVAMDRARDAEWRALDQAIPREVGLFHYEPTHSPLGDDVEVDALGYWTRCDDVEVFLSQEIAAMDQAREDE